MPQLRMRTAVNKCGHESGRTGTITDRQPLIPKGRSANPFGHHQRCPVSWMRPVSAPARRVTQFLASERRIAKVGAFGEYPMCPSGGPPMRLLLAIAAALIGSIVAVHADLLADGKICAQEHTDADAKLAACTRLINNPKPSVEHRAGAFAFRSSVYTKQGKYETALRDVTEAIRLFPEHVTAYNARCTLNIYKGEYRDAIADCTRAFDINSQNWVGLAGRAAAHYFLGNYHASIAQASAAIQLKPDNAETHRVRDYRRPGAL